MTPRRRVDILHLDDWVKGDAMKTKKTKDLTPKTPAKVKGGGRRINDNITLVRASSR